MEESDWNVVVKWAECRRHSDSEMNTEMNANDVSLHSAVEGYSPPSSPPLGEQEEASQRPVSLVIWEPKQCLEWGTTKHTPVHHASKARLTNIT